MNKRIIVLALISFTFGFIAFMFSPSKAIVEISGDIAIKEKRELVNDSTLIIYGTVNDILPSFWSNPDFKKGTDVRNIIQTDILVDIKKVYYNKPYDNKTVTVRINKGSIGDVTYTSEGYPDFEVGEEVILFLSEDDSDLSNTSEEYYVLTGMIQGKFSPKNKNNTNKKFTNSIADIEREEFDLNTIEDEIKTILVDLKKNPINKMSKEEIRKQNEKVLGK